MTVPHRTCKLCEATSAGSAVSFRRNAHVCRWCDAELARTGRDYCRACYATGPLSEMRRRYCVPCAQAARRAYRAAHLDRERARSRAYGMTRTRRRTETPTQRRARYQRNIERERASCRRYKERERERLRAYMQAYHRARYAADPLYWVATKRRRKVRLFRRLFG